jgi:para-nitrobenzyl esterase
MQDARMAASMGSEVRSSEDCLYLNVWTPAKSPAERLPVMVWIYGGAFIGGMTSVPMYDGTQLARKGVVLVSVAYRLGPFGFLAHPQLTREGHGSSGNYGLEDPIAALRWVRANIQKFGGDPSRVTIFGESAGAIAVSMLASSPQARGLFQRAISESGGNFAPPKYASEGGQNVPPLKLAEKVGEKFLADLGVADIKTARALPAEQVLKATGAGTGRFWPVFDGKVLPGDQYEGYSRGRFNDTPVLIGTNSDEGAMFARPGVTAASFEKQVRDGYGPNADAILAANPHRSDAEAALASKQLFRDSAFAWNTWTWARLQSSKGRNKAYVYYFDHRTPASPDGASHTTEIPFVFGNFASGAATGADARLSDLVSSYWVNFAKKGDPNGPGLPAWPAFVADNQVAMTFDEASGARALPNRAQLDALDAYYAWRRTEAAKQAH